jgi:hypothetical protein
VAAQARLNSIMKEKVETEEDRERGLLSAIAQESQGMSEFRRQAPLEGETQQTHNLPPGSFRTFGEAPDSSHGAAGAELDMPGHTPQHPQARYDPLRHMGRRSM